ncbi:prepilin-type N-terminal cleavage/methylation domain-containing protein [Hippea jasoniae]|uniref:prepilin-type N-terminal cleavage/methylation domain-containing protein n=1 Tax=Hippea jasoniae TaxID=944479 RepID=UPI0009FF3791|nr:prepilin-type N-terminal cleavage/methylation domain-containing protein [Hippea jasoniae]
MKIACSNGITLIELLVVIAIMAILAIIAIPQYNKYRANAAYTKIQTNLNTAKTWAENIVADEEKFPNGVCDATGYSGTGSIKCSYSPDNDTISIDANGDLKVDIPLKITFERDNGTCGKIIVFCPKNRCSGLMNHNNSNGATICTNTCDNPEVIKEDTNIHGVINGGCS